MNKLNFKLILKDFNKINKKMKKALYLHKGVKQINFLNLLKLVLNVMNLLKLEE